MWRLFLFKEMKTHYIMAYTFLHFHASIFSYDRLSSKGSELLCCFPLFNCVLDKNAWRVSYVEGILWDVQIVFYGTSDSIMASICLKSKKGAKDHNIQQVTGWVWAKKDGSLLVNHNEGAAIYLRSWRTGENSTYKTRRKRNKQRYNVKGTGLGSGRSGFWPLWEILFMSSRTSGSLFVKLEIGLANSNFLSNSTILWPWMVWDEQ